jgi:osmotically-inducible protein OsmY
MKARTIAGVGFIGGVAAAALLDPSQGRSRRAYMQQRGAGIMRRLSRRGARGMRAAESELYGATQKMRHLQPEERQVSDERLLDRVQSELFRDPSIPKGQINVNIEDGVVFLRGHVQDAAVSGDVERRARGISGVDRVENLIHVGA